MPLATVYVQVVAGILGVLYDSTIIRMEVLFRAVLEVRPDGVHTAGKLSGFEDLGGLFALRPVRFAITWRLPGKHIHGKLSFFFRISFFGCGSRSR